MARCLAPATSCGVYVALGVATGGVAEVAAVEEVLGFLNWMKGMDWVSQSCKRVKGSKARSRPDMTL